MGISVELIKKLRDQSGAGMMDAKKALVENDGDLKAAADWLRMKGKAKAASKADRVAGEGMIGLCIENGVGVLVEVNSETDFAAREPMFTQFVADLCGAALKVDDLESLIGSRIGGTSVHDRLTEMVAKFGENLVVRNMKKLTGESVHGYVHNSVAPGVGKIGTLVAASGLDPDTGKKVAMHVAAARPMSLSEEDAPADRVERERAVLTQIANDSGKPPAIIEKIVTGGLRKFFANETLLRQKYVINPDQTVADAVKEAGGEVTGFAYLKAGELQD